MSEKDAIAHGGEGTPQDDEPVAVAAAVGDVCHQDHGDEGHGVDGDAMDLGRARLPPELDEDRGHEEH